MDDDDFIVDDPIILQEDCSFFDAFVELDDSVQSNAFLEDTFSSITGLGTPTKAPVPLAVSTPRGTATPGRRSGSTNPVAEGKPQRLQCDECPNTYANNCTLATHKRMHAMKRATLRLPTLEQVKGTANVSSEAVIREMVRYCLPEVNEDSEQLSLLSQKLLDSRESESWTNVLDYLCEEFYTMVQSRNVLLPSALRSAVYHQTNKLLSNCAIRDHCKNLLTCVVDCDRGIAWLFLGSFIPLFFEKLLFSVFRVLQGEEVNRPVQPRDDMSSVDFQQTLYHIVGSVLHACFVRGRTYKHSSDWVAYCSVLKSKCIREPELGNECHNTVSAFSSAKDRGGYVHCNQETFDFFFKLFELLLSLEQEDRSLPLHLVDTEVSKSDILLFLWDDLIGSELTEQQSIFLLLMITHISVKIVVRGIIKRRINVKLKAAYSSVALRSSLAKRKK